MVSKVLEDVVGQMAGAKLLVSPLLERHVDIGDGSTQCGGILRRHGVHVLRLRPGQFVDLADVSRSDWPGWSQ